MIGGMLTFLASVGLVSHNYLSDQSARMKSQNYLKAKNVNFERQIQLKLMSMGDTPEKAKEFERLLGRPFDFAHCTLADREQAVWEIAQKEGWTYCRDGRGLDYLPRNCHAFDPSEDEEYNKILKRFK